MTLRLPGHWVWDSWFVVDGGLVHAFFLHAPRSLGDPDLRHHAARIGHAVSGDLVHWDLRAPALGPGPAGAFDDLATWTGSVIPHDGGWLLAYTGVSRREAGLVQRIGFATSFDLEAWTRAGSIVEADPRWYETDGAGEVHWRDPWLWRDPGGRLHLLITARANHGPVDGRGVIGHAHQVDDGRIRFEVGPPISVPGELRQLEVPQLLQLAPDRWVVVACADASDISAARAARTGIVPETGTLVLESARPLGPFRVADGPFLHGSSTRRSYAGRVVELRGRRWLMTWTATIDRSFVGELADPIPLALDRDGRLCLADPGQIRR